VNLFFIGIIFLVLGTLIIIFDYPQIQFLENKDLESYYLLDEEKKTFHQRLVLEFSIGIVILGLGSSLLVGSFLRRFENGFRQ
jgi:hypothetical protein